MNDLAFLCRDDVLPGRAALVGCLVHFDVGNGDGNALACFRCFDIGCGVAGATDCHLRNLGLFPVEGQLNFFPVLDADERENVGINPDHERFPFLWSLLYVLCGACLVHLLVDEPAVALALAEFLNGVLELDCRFFDLLVFCIGRLCALLCFVCNRALLRFPLGLLHRVAGLLSHCLSHYFGVFVGHAGVACAHLRDNAFCVVFRYAFEISGVDCGSICGGRATCLCGARSCASCSCIARGIVYPVHRGDDCLFVCLHDLAVFLVGVLL